MNNHENIVRIKAVSNSLGEIKNDVVFVGGATISCYPDRAFFEARTTDDVDIIVEILNYNDRSGLEEKLRSYGFAHDIESGIICRFKIEGIIVDIMPTDDPSIGFKNIWYPEGFKNAIEYHIDELHTVKILSSPYFVATKMEAFKGRGNGDGRISHDFEDIIFVLENRSIIWTELAACDDDLKRYLVTEFNTWIQNPNIFEWIDAHVERGSPPASYEILKKIKDFVKMYS